MFSIWTCYMLVPSILFTIFSKVKAVLLSFFHRRWCSVHGRLHHHHWWHWGGTLQDWKNQGCLGQEGVRAQIYVSGILFHLVQFATSVSWFSLETKQVKEQQAKSFYCRKRNALSGSYFIIIIIKPLFIRKGIEVSLIYNDSGCIARDMHTTRAMANKYEQ